MSRYRNPPSGVRLLAGLWLGLACLTARADDHDRIRELVAAGRIRPLAQILDRALAQHPGQVLEAELETRHGRYVYEIEILDRNGRVRERCFDARTGEALKAEPED